MKIHASLFALLLFICQLVAAQTVRISGSVRDASTNEPLAGANIYSPIDATGTITDGDGFFNLDIRRGQSTKISISYVGYVTQERTVSTTRNSQMDIMLVPGGLLDEVQVRAARRDFGIKGAQMGALAMDMERVKSLPALFGEVDVLKSLQKMPGVQASGEGNAGILVRGGDYDQNLITMDGAVIYNSEHLSGYVSAINPDITDDVVFYKGAFPARYGSRLSSIVDIGIRDGDFHEYHGQVSVGMLTSKIQAEGPLWRGHTSFNVAARASYFNWVVKPILRGITENYDPVAGLSDMNYYDINAKIAHKFGGKDKLTLSFYYSKDHNNEAPTESDVEYKETNGSYSSFNGGGPRYFEEGAALLTYYNSHTYKHTAIRENNWSNLIGSLNWEHVFSRKAALYTLASISNYNYNISLQSYDDEQYARAYAEEPYSADVGQSFGGGGGRIQSFKSHIIVTPPVSLLFLKKEYTTALTSTYKNKVTDVDFTTDFSWQPNTRHDITVGATASYKQVSPLVGVDRTDTSYVVDDPDNVMYAVVLEKEYTYTESESRRQENYGKEQGLLSTAVYAEDNIRWGSWLATHIGVRGAMYRVSGKSRFSIEPRLSMSISINEDMSVKLGYARMSQAMYRLSSNDVATTTDLWVPLTKDLGLATADQVSVGYYQNLTSSVGLSLEGYYKKMNNLLEYRNGMTYINGNGSWQDLVAQGKGKSYGIEFLLEKKTGNTTGWISYTWSRSLRTFDREGMELNGGREYSAANDRPHNLNIVLTQKLGKNWDFTASWTYTSGMRRSLTNVSYYLGTLTESNGWTQQEGQGTTMHDVQKGNSLHEYNGYVFPATHHLDVSLNCHIQHGRSQSTVNLSIYNLYNRKNISSAYLGYENGLAVLKGICRFPFMPSLNYTLKF